MSAAAFAYSVLRYSHDPVAGEHLNIGVALFCSQLKFVDVKFEYRYERLSAAFANFNGDHYRRTISRFEAALDRQRDNWLKGQMSLFSNAESNLDLPAILHSIWPDSGLSFHSSEVLGGITAEPVEELHHAFERFVTSQYERDKQERRSNEEVWAVYRQALSETVVLSKLQPKMIVTPDFQYEFPHALKNGKWHLLEPVSFDYSRAETLQERATKYLGIGTALRESEDIGKLYLLLGRPRVAAYSVAYDKAKHLLTRMPIPHELVEEDDASSFARDLARIAS